MANCILAFPNYVDATAYTVSFSGGSWEASLPLTNLRDERIVKVARSTNDTVSNTLFTCDLGVLRDVRVVAIPNHNMSRAALVKVTAATDSGFTNTVLNTGWVDVWRQVYEFGTLPFGHPSFWTGKLTAEDAEGYTMPFVYVADAAVQARYWKVEVDDDANTDGYVELARLVLAPGYQPTRNMSYGAQIGWEDETEAQKSLGGARFYDRRGKRRVATFTLPFIEVDEGFAWPFEIARRQGVSRQIFFVFDPADDTNLHRGAFLATIRELSPLEFTAFNLTSSAFALEEVIA